MRLRGLISPALVLLMVAAPAAALERYYLKKSEVFCDTGHTLCLSGNITYERNSRLLSLRARVQKQTGPGKLRLYFSGTNRQDMLRRTEIVLDIRGTYSEIINHSMRPDAPDVENWQLTGFLFTGKHQ